MLKMRLRIPPPQVERKPDVLQEEELAVVKPKKPKKESKVKQKKNGSRASHEAWVAKQRKTYEVSIAKRKKSIEYYEALIASKVLIIKRLTQKMRALK